MRGTLGCERITSAGPHAQTLGALFSVDDLTGFEITKAVELPEPFGIIVLWGLVLPALFIFANALTQLAFKDALILKVRRVPSTNFCRMDKILFPRRLLEMNGHPCQQGWQSSALSRWLRELQPAQQRLSQMCCLAAGHLPRVRDGELHLLWCAHVLVTSSD